MLEPVVTLIICTRNRASQLQRTLASLSAMTTAQLWEAIIVDNASTDTTKKVIIDAARADPRIRYIKVDRIGLGAGRDAAWRLAKGAIISYTDDDCYLHPQYVDEIVTAFSDFPSAGAIGGRILLYDPADARITIDERTEQACYPARSVIRAGFVQGANLSFRIDALCVSGGFDPALGAGTKFPCEDVDAVAAISWAGFEVRYDPRPTVYHHHRRTAAEIPALLASYDAGRGAYWAKYVIRRDTRSAYAKEWSKITLSGRSIKSIKRTNREIKSAFQYMIFCKKIFPILIILLFIAPIYLTSFLMMMASKVKAKW